MERGECNTGSSKLPPTGFTGDDWLRHCLHEGNTVREAIDRIDNNGKGIALITDPQGKLLGTITDGDVRRWILTSKPLEARVAEVLAHKRTSSKYPHPISAPATAGRDAILRLMQERVIHQMPLVDADGTVVGLVTMDDLIPSEPLGMQAVIMAGGFGTRLRPLTIDLPKPMLPVGDRPLMELIVRQLQTAGIRRVNVTTHYKSEKIIEHFGNGDRFGMEFNYVSEDRPLGTAGALSLMEPPKERLLVMNGDILTGVDFRAMLNYHQEHTAMLTVGVRTYEFKVPYGVIEREGDFVRKVVEKPSLTFFVNAGIYLLEPRAHPFIPRGQRFDMTDLISLLIEKGHHVACFPILEYWLDIGQHVDYEKAIKDIQTGRFAA
jgi:dTDP-glucose pyrophosphorylase/CBS domain-containing protein